MATLNFDATQYQPAESYTPIPEGWYTVMITESENCPTRDGNGAFLKLKLVVCEGECKGRVLYDRLNLWNHSAIAVDIARRTLSAICYALNILHVEDSTALHNQPLQAKVTIRPAQGSYSASNDIKGYKAVEFSEPQDGAAAFAQTVLTGSAVPQPQAAPAPVRPAPASQTPPAPQGGYATAAPQNPQPPTTNEPAFPWS